MTMADWDPTLPSSLSRYLQISRYVYASCRRYSIQQIHCAKVLPEGLIALFIKLVKKNSLPPLCAWGGNSNGTHLS